MLARCERRAKAPRDCDDTPAAEAKDQPRGKRHTDLKLLCDKTNPKMRKRTKRRGYSVCPIVLRWRANQGWQQLQADDARRLMRCCCCYCCWLYEDRYH